VFYPVSVRNKALQSMTNTQRQTNMKTNFAHLSATNFAGVTLGRAA
jgi:hypothetical protein